MTRETREKIARQTRLIIRKDGEYLVRVQRLGARGIDPVWSHSAYDAWATRDRDAARRVARRLEGVIVMFNPIIGKIREMGA